MKYLASSANSNCTTSISMSYAAVTGVVRRPIKTLRLVSDFGGLRRTRKICAKSNHVHRIFVVVVVPPQFDRIKPRTGGHVSPEKTYKKRAETEIAKLFPLPARSQLFSN